METPDEEMHFKMLKAQLFMNYITSKSGLLVTHHHKILPTKAAL